MMKRICLLAVLCILFSSCQGRDDKIAVSSTLEETKGSEIFSEITEYEAKGEPTKTSKAITTPLPAAPEITKIETISTAVEYNDPQLVFYISNEDNNGGNIVFSHNGELLAQAGEKIQIWKLDSGMCIFEKVFPYEGYVTKLLFNPEDEYVSISLQDNSIGENHLLIWNVDSGTLIQDISQQSAKITTFTTFSPDPIFYYIAVDAIAFFPNENKLAYANGHDIEIIDISGKNEPVRWSLGEEMYASEISIRDDGEMLYFLMEWDKQLTFSSLYTWKYRVEIWQPNPNGFMKAIRFEEFYQNEGSRKWLVGQYLVEEDRPAGLLTALNLTTDTYQEFPYRSGQKYFNDDASLMFVARFFGDSDNQIRYEVWNTDTWRSSTTFSPAYTESMVWTSDAVFHPNKNMVAIDYGGSIYVYDISFLNE